MGFNNNKENRHNAEALIKMKYKFISICFNWYHHVFKLHPA
jgi:hypothetical protein